MGKDEMMNIVREVRKYLKMIEEGGDTPAIERYAHMADIYCSLLENHIDEEKELWN
jgi:hemerythrin-like domain-containing protein